MQRSIAIITAILSAGTVLACTVINGPSNTAELPPEDGAASSFSSEVGEADLDPMEKSVDESSDSILNEEDLVTRNVTFTGVVEEGGLSMIDEGEYRLSLTDGRMVLLESYEEDVPFVLYAGKFVRVHGDVKPSLGGAGTLMLVREIKWLRRETLPDGSEKEVERILCDDDDDIGCTGGSLCLYEDGIGLCYSSESTSSSVADSGTVSPSCPEEYLCAQVSCEEPQKSHCIRIENCRSCCTCYVGDAPPVPKEKDDMEEKECVVGGCSGQLCMEEGQEDGTTCEWRDVYACYKSAVCERQKNGTCGWTSTKEFDRCLMDGGEKEPTREGSEESDDPEDTVFDDAQVKEEMEEEVKVDLSSLETEKRELIERMADEDYSPVRWTQVYCSTHVGVCLDAHKNWWYKSFGATATVIWHFELGAAPVEVFGDGPISVDLKTGSLESLGIEDGAVQIIGSRVIGYRSWTEDRHFEVSAFAPLRESVQYITKKLRVAEEE